MTTYSEENTKTKKVHVSGLQIGMYVSKLDVDWLDTPFMYQGFLIESMDDIEQLEKYCEYVWIDQAEDKKSRRRLQILNKPLPSATRTNYVNKVPMHREFGQSHRVFAASRRKIKSLLKEATLGNTVDTESAKETVQHCLASVLRNPNAMLWMSKIRSADEYTSEHCLNVCILAIAFGRHLGKSEDELEELGLCAAITRRRQNAGFRMKYCTKPGKLTPKEWKIIQAHTVHGRNLLMSSADMGQTVEVAYSHHERIDGGGYPRRFAGSSNL